MAYKMKGHSLPGINQRKSPAKHATDDWGFKHGEENHRGTTGTGNPAPGHEKKSPGKWVQFIPMALSAISSMKKNKEEKE